MSESITLNLTILNRQYKVKTEPQNEEFVKQQIASIQEKIFFFKTNFPGKDVQDYLSMVLIDTISNVTETKNLLALNEKNFQQLQQINSLLD